MGFLKFLKREKKKEGFDELDLPPAPPPLEGFDENMALPDFPDFGEEKISGTKEMPKFDFPDEEIPSDLGQDMPEFPAFPEIEEKPTTPILPFSAPPSVPAPSIPQPMPEPQETVAQEEQQEQFIYPKIGRGLFSREKISRERPHVKTIYVRVDKFKATLGSINMTRSDLRKSEEALMKLENIKNAKDKSFDKMKSSLDDLQKKLIFIDKTLFKG